MKYRNLIFIAVIIAVLIVAVNAFNPAVYDVGPLQIELGLHIGGHSETRLILPPFGELIAQTHKMPVTLKATLIGVDFTELEELANDESMAEFQKDMQHAMYKFFLRIIIQGVMIGAGAAWLWQRKRKHILQGTVVALVFLVSIGLITGLTYDRTVLQEPSPTGTFQMPWVLRVIAEGRDNLPVWMERMETLVDNANYLLTADLYSDNNTSEGLKILHVSDIHNNPIAITIIDRIINNMKIDLVIDTGDLTDLGQTLELELTANLRNLDVPYLFVPGNHDSPEVVDVLYAYKPLSVLQDKAIDIDGLTILGIADPQSYSFEFSPLENANTYNNKWLNLSNEDLKNIDIVATHDLNYANHLLGKVPIVLHGHNHQINYSRYNQVKDGVLTHIIGAGSTGAEGIRGLQLKDEVPFTACILDLNDEKQLKTVILLKFYLFSNRVITERIDVQD